MAKQKKIPKISVIMPVYNCSRYLEEALASLLIQTFRDFEVLAINDGSTDDSLKILEKFAKCDKRIRIINQDNSGIVKVLNRGINEAKAEYIARMDGDDICFPNRFMDQIKLLDEHPEVVLAAGNFEVINENSEFLYKEFVIPNNGCIQRAFYLRNAIAHGSVMFRKPVVEKLGGYSEKFGPTEDMELWMRLLDEGDFVSTDSFIYKWRVNTQGLTSQNNKLSRAYSQSHLTRRWEKNSPKYFSRCEIKKLSKSLLTDFEQNGHRYMDMALLDLSSISIKTFFSGSKTQSLKQFIAVLSSGGAGFKLGVSQFIQMAKRLIRRWLGSHNTCT